jgi:hypothetical protein
MIEIRDTIEEQAKDSYYQLLNGGFNRGYLVVYTDYVDNTTNWFFTDEVDNEEDLLSFIINKFKKCANTQVNYIYDMSLPFDNDRDGLVDCVNSCLVYFQFGRFTYVNE